YKLTQGSKFSPEEDFTPPFPTRTDSGNIAGPACAPGEIQPGVAPGGPSPPAEGWQPALPLSPLAGASLLGYGARPSRPAGSRGSGGGSSWDCGPGSSSPGLLAPCGRRPAALLRGARVGAWRECCPGPCFVPAARPWAISCQAARPFSEGREALCLLEREKGLGEVTVFLELLSNSRLMLPKTEMVLLFPQKVRISSEVRDMKKQTPDLRVMAQRNKSVEEDGADKNQRSCSEKVHRENATCGHESTVVKLPVIASFAGTTKKIVMVKHPAPLQKPSYSRSNFHIKSSPISLEKTKTVSKAKNRVRMLQTDSQNLKRDKTEEMDTVMKDSDEISSTDSDTSKNISGKGKITRESCKERSRVISKAKQKDLDVELRRVLRKGSKQPSVRSAREQLEEARDVTRPDTSKIYKKNFQQSKPEEPTSTPALPVKVVARSIDEIIASLQSTSPSPSDQTIKELLESVLGQNYNIKMEKTPVVQKESQAAENESRPKDELLTYKKQVNQDSHEPKMHTAYPEELRDRGAVKVSHKVTEICYEGVPISEQFQKNRTDGIHFLPSHTSKSVTECQKVVECCPKKPELQLLGQKSHSIEDVVFEDFFADHEEELEAEQDENDLYDYGLVCITTSLIKRSVSALEMTAFKDETTLNMSANFKTSMQELKVMKQWIAEPEVETEIGKSSPTKHLLNQICDDPQSMQTDIPVEKTPTLTGQEDSKNDILLVESVSLGRLPIHDTFSIKVSSAIKQYQSPSIPCLLDFEKFAEVRGGIPKEISARMWVSGIWNCWFDETFPPSETASGEDTELQKGTKMVDSQEANLQIELVDSLQPVLLEGATVSIEDLEKEVRRLTELIEKEEHPSAFHYCRRGAIQRKLGKLKSAMDDLEKAISLEPLLLNAYWHRHLIYLFQDRISAALDDLNFITERSKNNTDAYLSMAEIYRKRGDNTLATISYSSAIRYSPTNDDIYFRRAELYFEENQLLLAMDDYAKCFQYNPKRTDALMKHGIHFFDCSVLTTAIQDFTAVIKEDPSNAQARLYRGRAYAKQQQYRNAMQDLAAAIRLDPSCWLAFYYRGCILRQIDPKRAVQDFSVSVLINDTQENFGSFLHRGIVYSEQCQWSLAICDFENVLALNSSVIFAYLNIGLILLLHLDQYYEAIQQFTNAIEIDPLNVRAYVCRAQAYHKSHDLPNAVKDINRAIHLYPNKSQLYILSKYVSVVPLLKDSTQKLETFGISEFVAGHKVPVKASQMDRGEKI
ncbi:PREDICTED: uncharacterized protein LOC104379110, partial [Tauraco erythrolophus]|uniref:uncharacterized protein LOC104379110 n=1 Tax=Tauraco erythrolophus TaxID=121530 RepID=UPI0005239656